MERPLNEDDFRREVRAAAVEITAALAKLIDGEARLQQVLRAAETNIRTYNAWCGAYDDHAIARANALRDGFMVEEPQGIKDAYTLLQALATTLPDVIATLVKY